MIGLSLENLEPIDGDAFISLRHAIFMNFIAANAPIQEEDLTPEVCRQLIEDIGEDYVRRNKRGILTIRNLKISQINL